MSLFYSPTAGVLVRPTTGSLIPDVHYLAGQEQWSDVECLHVLSSIQDWEFVDSDNDGLVPVIERCRSDYWTSRAQSLIICLIGGVSDSLAIEVLEHVESIIQSRCSANQLLNRLLIAPLKDSRRVGALAKCALGGGFATVGGLLDRIVDLQALLRRLIGMWLNLPAGEFADLPVSREAFWQNLAAQSLLTRLLEAADKPAFRTAWATLAFDEAGVPGRLCDYSSRQFAC